LTEHPSEPFLLVPDFANIPHRVFSAVKRNRKKSVDGDDLSSATVVAQALLTTPAGVTASKTTESILEDRPARQTRRA
jgi:hypothetical protein